MNGKLCRAPAGGGSARGGVRYILGYTLGAKEEQGRESFHELMREATAREDLCVGAVWLPTTGGGVRPAAIFAKNLTSLATADVEMDAVARTNPRVKQSVQHFVFSVHPDQAGQVTPERMIRAAQRALEKIGLGEHGQVHAVHLDEPHPHVHVIVETVNPVTLRAWDRLRNYPRLSWALRETEIELALPRDRGLAVTRELADGSVRVEWATRAERASWARERREERLEDLARRYAGDYTAFESPETWVREVVAVRIAERLEVLEQRGEQASWAEVHAIAGKEGVRLLRRADGAVVARIYERVSGGLQLADDRAAGRREREVSDALVTSPTGRSRDTGIEVVIDAAVLGGEHREPFLQSFQDAAEAERELIRHVRDDPSLVSREIVASGKAAFTREDIDRFLAVRVTDPDDVLALSQYIEQNDATLRMLSADTVSPLFTTAAQLAREQRLEASALAMARLRDEAFDRAALDRAIAVFEVEKGFRISPEQRAALDRLQCRLAWIQGDAGTGKTTLMQITRRYCELTGRTVVGVTTSQAAAGKLQLEAGFEAMNAARARQRDLRGDRAAVGAQVLDETSMTDIDAVQRVIDKAHATGSIVLGIGDGAQLPAIGAGDAHAIISRVAQQAGSYAELTEVRRQRDGLEWMRDVVPRLGKAIRTQDAEGISASVREIAGHGIFRGCQNRDEMIQAAAAQYLAYRREGIKALLNTRSKLVAKHLNTAIREQLGLAGTGVSFETTRGVREAAIGDRIVFLRNNERKLGVLNGYVGTVRDVRLERDRWTIEVELDGGRLARFDPRKYRDWDWGYAVTTHKAQGRDDPADIFVFDRSADARALHVGLTRAVYHLHAFYNEENFATVDEIARHMGERIGVKDDALLFEEIVRRTGGADTPWAKRVRAARTDERDPMRVEYLATQRERRERYERAVTAVHDQFRQRARVLTNAGSAEKKALGREHAAAAAALRKEFAPQPFLEWAAEQRDRIERETERMQALHCARERYRTRQCFDGIFRHVDQQATEQSTDRDLQPVR